MTAQANPRVFDDVVKLVLVDIAKLHHRPDRGLPVQVEGADEVPIFPMEGVRAPGDPVRPQYLVEVVIIQARAAEGLRDRDASVLIQGDDSLRLALRFLSLLERGRASKAQSVRQAEFIQGWRC